MASPTISFYLASDVTPKSKAPFVIVLLKHAKVLLRISFQNDATLQSRLAFETRLPKHEMSDGGMIIILKTFVYQYYMSFYFILKSIISYNIL